MNMTNREESSAAEHETFPGPGPLTAEEAKRGIHPVEQMVDAAIDRIARERAVAGDKGPATRSGLGSDGGGAEWTQADRGRTDPAKADRAKPDRSKASSTKPERGKLDRSAVDPGHALALAQPDGPATLAMAGSARRAKARLRWKGLDVSEEFRSYADRVARGEDLPPFQGKILAEPDPAFPWNPGERDRSQSRALKQQFGLWTGVALFLGLSVWVLVVQVGKTDTAPGVPESPLAAVVLSNQPSQQAAPRPEDAPAEPPEVEAAGIEAPAQASPAAAQSTTALASLQERSSSVRAAPILVAPTSSSAARAASAPSPGVIFAAPAPALNSVVPNLTASGASHAAPGSSVSGSSVSGSSATGAGSSLASSVTSPGTALPVAPAPVSAVDPTGSVASTDPKKEPGREASTMGPLLVESPSF